VTDFFASGRAFDLVLACLAVEGVALLVFHARTGRGPEPADIAGFLGAGFGLALAARAVIGGWPWVVPAAGLMLALAAHLFDLARRWRKPVIRAPSVPV